MKVDADLLRIWALGLLDDEERAIMWAKVETTSKSAGEVINKNFVRDSLMRYNIFWRVRTGKKKLSDTQIQQRNKEKAHHFGVLHLSYLEGLSEADVENHDETHFTFYMENGRVSDFQGTTRLTYAELSSGLTNFTVCVRISGGPQCKLEPCMVVFQDKQRNCPISSAPDEISGVCYRTQPKGWMGQQLFPSYFRETRTITAFPGGVKESCKSILAQHTSTAGLEEALTDIRTSLVRFPKNFTHLIQPLDQLVLRAFKALFRKKWAIERAKINQHTNTGRLVNPVKRFFLQLVKDCTDEINQRIDGA